VRGVGEPVLLVDPLGEQGDVTAAFGRGEGQDVTPGPVKVIGQVERLAVEPGRPG